MKIKCRDCSAPRGKIIMGNFHRVARLTVSSSPVLLGPCYSNRKGQVNDILRDLGRDVVSCRLLRIVYLRLIYTERKRTRKQFFPFDL